MKFVDPATHIFANSVDTSDTNKDKMFQCVGSSHVSSRETLAPTDQCLAVRWGDNQPSVLETR